MVEVFVVVSFVVSSTLYGVVVSLGFSFGYQVNCYCWWICFSVGVSYVVLLA